MENTQDSAAAAKLHSFTGKRIINVSNRLPVKVSFTGDKFTYQNSEGGLATGLGSVFSQCENIWIGWPGAEISVGQRQEIADELSSLHLHPVFLSAPEIQNFYEGCSNEVIWPLFHYFPTYSNYDPQYWESYVSVNRKFTDEILKVARKDDTIWIHDYHLMLVPQMLREAIPDISIGYFQHIPFPSTDIFRALPWKEQIVRGLLGADLIGFQTESDVTHFTDAAAQFCKMYFKDNQAMANGRRIQAMAFPISIDYRKFADLASHSTTRKIAHKIRKQINTDIIVSIDRLDYSKGIIQRLQAYDLFLRQHPEWRQKITYIHLIVPSRENVCNYKTLKEEMNRLISDINGRYATFGWQPIHHFYRSFPPNLLSAIYRSADVALVTPLIDGMNLVSKEYVASNTARDGVLILGENAGAAKELTEALIINPNDIRAFSGAIHQALTMPAAARSEAMGKMQCKIERADIFAWAHNFLQQLKATKDQRRTLPLMVNTQVMEKIDHLYSVSNKRLILLDYDGTVVPFVKRPEEAKPNAALISVLQKLASDQRNDVVIISGRDSATLEKWLGHLPVKIVAEHGAWYKEIGNTWQSIPHLHTAWKDSVSRTLSGYSLSSPGAFIEEKTYSIAWHYRAARDSVSEPNIKEIVAQLKKQINNDLDILLGNMVIEIKNKSVNKGTAVLRLISRKKYDFVLAIGDDKTDEDMFEALPEDTITIKVGNDSTAAAYRQPSYLEVNALLREISRDNKISLAAS